MLVVGWLLLVVVGVGVGRVVIGACCCVRVLFVLFAVNGMC